MYAAFTASKIKTGPKILDQNMPPRFFIDNAES